jgi:hypothetical protein
MRILHTWYAIFAIFLLRLKYKRALNTVHNIVGWIIIVKWEIYVRIREALKHEQPI